jgi:methyl-accepting chemotaxis protein
MLQKDAPPMVQQEAPVLLNSTSSTPGNAPFSFKKRRFSLSVYISVLLVLTAILPLLVTIGSIEIFLRPALIDQISTDMQRVTQTHIQLIDTYLSERLNDVKTLSETAAVKTRLQGAANDTEVRNIFLSTQHRDVANYINLSLLNAQGKSVVSYPSTPSAHGKSKYLIVPEARQALQQTSDIQISNVFYDLASNTPSVDLYARVTDNNFNILGYVRASLGLRRIWGPVDSEPQTNGTGTYATILDQNGVRIAYTNSDHSGFTHSPYLFQSIAQLPTKVQQQIQDENLYGNDTHAVSTMADTGLADFKNSGAMTNRITPAGQQDQFQVARYNSTVVPWTYVLFKPFSAVTGLADQQLFTIIIIVTLVLIVALAAGLIVGRSLAVPILRSVSLLRKSNVSLKTLADEESVVAAEQTWMVEASQVALKSVQYYTNATSVAAKRINTLSNDLVRDINYLDKEKLQQALHEMIEAAAYIERSVKHQETMNDRLATSLRVTTQATEQLTRGATSTNEAASQMEYIVEQLTSVVGER